MALNQLAEVISQERGDHVRLREQGTTAPGRAGRGHERMIGEVPRGLIEALQVDYLPPFVKLDLSPLLWATTLWTKPRANK